MPGRCLMTKPLAAHEQDFPGELALRLAELERGRAEGTVPEGRILAFLAEVRQLAEERDLKPWRVRAVQGVVLAMICWGGWDAVAIVFPDLGERLGAGLDLALGLGFLALLYAGLGQLVYARRSTAAQAWFEGLEATIRRGGRIVDYLRQERGHEHRNASGF